MGKIVITKEKELLLRKKIREHKQKSGPLMPSLHDAQEIFGCIPLEVQKIISEELKISVSKINGVVTFYSRFSLEPKGKHVIGVCLGTACYVKGSQAVLDEICNTLQIKVGETTKDELFSVEATRCVGACGLAPVFTIDGKVYGHATVQSAAKELRRIIDWETGTHEN
ncbi:MAG TPA: NAD(P)H-dependent oxidoreductase subunit E [Acholeplasma sp.]|jgi:NADH:ubiquinone oxidoreductase subunit E|nr:NAD(P)H-dependent oxidoreductase subunit E [Acholeplasma sp.]